MQVSNKKSPLASSAQRYLLGESPIELDTPAGQLAGGEVALVLQDAEKPAKHKMA